MLFFTRNTLQVDASVTWPSRTSTDSTAPASSASCRSRQLAKSSDTDLMSQRCQRKSSRVTPTVFAMSNPLRTPPPEQRAQGVAVVTRDDFRWHRCDIKSVSLLANCLLRQEADDAGAVESVLLRDGHVTEASTCNMFLVKNGTIVTPPKDNLILPGITYDLVLELARAAGLPVEVRRVPVAELAAADELWLSSSTKEVLPVTRIDGRPVGSGKPGPMYARMYQLYQDYKARCGAGRQERMPEPRRHRCSPFPATSRSR